MGKAIDYKSTILLPKTEFPMRANLSQKESEMLKFWQENNIYQKLLEKRKNNKKFILHDGPPYSNGPIHIGQALNKILKDIVIKYKSMQGFFAPFVPGWDNHGMPIENGVVEELKKQGIEINREIVRKRCREAAEKWVKVQKSQFEELGIFGFWKDPYLTMLPAYEATILYTFAELVEKGYIYRSFRPIHWCLNCETALANIEIEYAEKSSISIWIRFPLRKDKKKIFSDLPQDKVYALVWTTTPWTIPANLAITLHPDFIYVIATHKDNYYLLAKALVDEVKKSLSFQELRVVKEFKGEELEGEIFKHPIFEKDIPVILDTFPTLTQGTGCVHTAPGHGMEDFAVGMKYKLPVLSPVNSKGYFTKEAGEFANLSLKEGDEAVVKALKREGNLLKVETITHQYPHCWRCGNPLIFRATEQWFMSIDHLSHKAKMLEEIKKVKWYPKESYERIKGFLEVRPDWCLSRQKFWGIGIPAFHCKKCGTSILSPEVIRKTAELVKENGSDIWFDKRIDASYFRLKCQKCGSSDFKKEKDVLDVWFDSSVSYLDMLNREGHTWPADLYLEGSDQHRGWFNLSLVVGMAIKNSAPYKSVITHGFVLDEKGFAMHKHLGNVVDPKDIKRKYGAEILRLWVASNEYSKDMRCSDEIIERIVEAYRKIRNTIRFMLGVLWDFEPKKQVKYENMLPLDKFMLYRTQELLKKVNKFYEDYEFHKVFHTLYNFVTVDLSSFYLDVLKDTLYTHSKDSLSRRSAQTALYYILDTLLKQIAPIMSFTAEEAYKLFPYHQQESIFLEDFPKVINEFYSPQIAEGWKELLKVRDLVLKALEEKRKDGKLGSSLDSRILISSKDDRIKEILVKHQEYLPTFFIVSHVEILDKIEAPDIIDKKLKISVKVERPKGRKCARCWIWSETTGKDHRYPDICEKCVSAIAK